MNREALEININKCCIITESVIAGLGGKEGIIKEVSGNSIQGFRYTVEIDKPLYSFTTKTIFYPPTFLCKIIE